jgi:DNA-binding IclR family transcriptional regulator
VPVVPSNPRRRSGVQSVEVGASLLRALADADGPQSLGVLARAAGMSSAKAHRYLVSYVQSGLAVQSERSGAYDLGPLAVRVGLAALERFDVVRLAGERLGSLRDEIDQTVMLSVWTDAGPTVARIELSGHPVTLAVRVGTTFPLLTSATGLIFLTYAPDLVPAAQLSEELALAASSRGTGAPGDGSGVARLRAEIRAQGFAFVDQSFMIGICALAVPLFHSDGRLAAALSTIGRRGLLEPDGQTARALRAFAAAGSPSLP